MVLLDSNNLEYHSMRTNRILMRCKTHLYMNMYARKQIENANYRCDITVIHKIHEKSKVKVNVREVFDKRQQHDVPCLVLGLRAASPLKVPD